MPILGLTTDSVEGAGLPRIAKLHKGEEKPDNSNRPGKDLDYFRVTFEPEFEYLAPLFTELYGEKPDEFGRVFLASATVDEAFQSWKEEWTVTALLHRCDGKEQVQWYNKDTGQYMQSRILCDANHTEHPCACKATGRLNMILADFMTASGVLGYVAVETHSVNDILTMYRYLKDIERMYGTLRGVPFIFGRSAREISAPVHDKNGDFQKRINVQKSLFYVHVEPEFMREQIIPVITNPSNGVPQLQPANGSTETDRMKKLLGAGTNRLVTPDAYNAPEKSKAPELTDVEPGKAHWSETELDDFCTKLLAGLDILDCDTALKLTGADKWFAFPDRKGAGMAVLDAVKAQHIRVKATSFEYVNQDGAAYIVFKAPLEPRWYQGRGELAKRLDMEELIDIEPGVHELSFPVLITWEQKTDADGSPSYVVAVDIQAIKPEATPDVITVKAVKKVEPETGTIPPPPVAGALTPKQYARNILRTKYFKTSEFETAYAEAKAAGHFDDDATEEQIVAGIDAYTLAKQPALTKAG